MEWFQSGIPVVWMKTRRFWYEFTWAEVEHRPEEIASKEQFTVWVPDNPTKNVSDNMKMSDMVAFGLAWQGATNASIARNYPVYYQVTGPDGTFLYTLVGNILQRF